MNKILNIFLITGILFLFVGAVYATNIDDLKVPQNCKPLNNGTAAFTNHVDRMLYVEKVVGDYKTDYFTNTSDMDVDNVANNIYYCNDTTLEGYGYEEIIELGGEMYMVSITQSSRLSPGEEKLLLDYMKEFNKVNNLEPVEV